jgi:N-acetylneuraminic acid mutarotase
VWYSTDGTGWTQVPSAAWFGVGRAGHSAVVFNSMIWTLGGAQWNGSSFTYTGFNEVWYSSDGAVWTKKATAPPWSERSNHASVVWDNKMWVIGGQTGTDGSAYTDEAWYTSDGDTWSKLAAPSGFSVRAGFACVVYNNRIWVMGGDTSNLLKHVLSDVWYYGP